MCTLTLQNFWEILTRLSLGTGRPSLHLQGTENTTDQGLLCLVLRSVYGWGGPGISTVDGASPLGAVAKCTTESMAMTATKHAVQLSRETLLAYTGPKICSRSWRGPEKCSWVWCPADLVYSSEGQAVLFWKEGPTFRLLFSQVVCLGSLGGSVG